MGIEKQLPKVVTGDGAVRSAPPHRRSTFSKTSIIPERCLVASRCGSFRTTRLHGESEEYPNGLRRVSASLVQAGVFGERLSGWRCSCLKLRVGAWNQIGFMDLRDRPLIFFDAAQFLPLRMLAEFDPSSVACGAVVVDGHVG